MRAQRICQVRFQQDAERYLATGSNILTDGIRVFLPDVHASEIVYIVPAEP